MGLKTCLPRTRSRNLVPTARAAATAAHARASVRSSRHSDSAEMSALLAPEVHGAPVHGIARALHRQGRAHRDERLQGRHVEIEPGHAVGEQ